MNLLHHLLVRRSAFTLLPTKHLRSAPKISVPLQVPTAALEARVSSISHLCQRKVLQTPMADKEGGRGLRSPADFCLAMHLMWQHSGRRGCAATSSLGAFASSSKDRDPQQIHSLGSIHLWPGASHQKHDSKCHIHAPIRNANNWHGGTEGGNVHP